MGDLFLSGTIGPIFYDLLMLAALIGVGAFLGFLCERIGIPAITGHVVAGILAGIVLLLAEAETIFDELKILGDLALTFIAFELGTRLYLHKVSHNLSEVILIVIFQAVFTIGVVMGLFIVIGAPWEMALIVGVIAVATSPETIMVLTRRYRSHGCLTDAIMPHIGMDDLLGVIIFAMAMAIATSVNAQTELSIGLMIGEPTLEIIGSMIIGGAIGALLAGIIAFTKKKAPEQSKNFLIETLFALVLVLALTKTSFPIGDLQMKLSPILTPMFTGIVFTNLIPKAIRKENDEAIDAFTPPFILIFFSLIGIQFVTSIIETPLALWLLMIIALAYALLRVLGKYIGVFVGSKIKKTPKEIVRYLVWSLLPQATVSIGMAQIVLDEEGLPESWRTIIFAVVMIAGIFYQVIGPAVAQKTLIASNEIEPERLTFFSQPEKPAKRDPGDKKDAE